jgi:hypothetical protein
MIPMSCPNCGSQGEVPLDRLNSRLKCRKCATMFYMDETGSIILGDPNDPKAIKRRKKAERGGPALDFDFNIGKMIRDIPRPVRLGVLGLAVLAAVGFGVSALMASLSMPEDVEGRTAYLGPLFVDNELARLRELAAPGTADDLATWHSTMRPKLNYEGPRRSGGDVLTSAAIMRTDASSAQSFLSLIVSGAPPAAPKATPDPDAPQNSLTMGIIWTKLDGAWLVDGTKTLAEATKPKKAGTPRGRSGRQ